MFEKFIDNSQTPSSLQISENILDSSLDNKPLEFESSSLD